MDGIKDENRNGCCSSSVENAEQVRCAYFSSFESPRIVARRKRLLAEVPLVDGSCESRPRSGRNGISISPPIINKVKTSKFHTILKSQNKVRCVCHGRKESTIPRIPEKLNLFLL